MSILQASLLLIFLTGILSGFSVLFLNLKSKLHWAWFLHTLSIGVWGLGLFGVISSNSLEATLWWDNILSISAILIPFFYLVFIISFLNLEKKYKTSKIVVGFLAVALVGLNFTDLFRKGMKPVANFDFWADPGKLYFLFPIFFGGVILYAFALLIKGYVTSEDRRRKKQIKLLTISQMLGYAGGFVNFWPALMQSNNYPYIGNYLVAACLLVVSYVVLRHRVFDFKAITTRLLLFALWIIVFMRTLMSQNSQDVLVNLSILAISLVIGGILIRVSQKEIDQRERAEELAQNLEEANKKLKALNERQKEFLSFASHQLKTPITSIKGYTSMLLEGSFGELSDSVEEAVRKVFVSANSMRRAVDDFLNVSRIEQGRLEYEMEVFDLSKIVKEVINELRSHASKKNLSLKKKVDKSEEYKVKGDKEKVKQVVNNLVDNSIKYTKEGEVKVTLSKRVDEENEEVMVRLEVADTGMGMSQETIESLFQKYERADNVKKQDVSGTGLGLYIAKEMVEAQGGKIWAESEGEGKGSTFYVELSGV